MQHLTFSFDASLEVFGRSEATRQVKLTEISYCDGVVFPIVGGATVLVETTVQTLETVANVFAKVGLFLNVGVGKTACVLSIREQKRGKSEVK